MAEGRHSSWNLRRREWIVVDMLLSAVSIILAYGSYLGFHNEWAPVTPTQPGAIPAALIYPCLVVLAGHVAGLHDPLEDRRRWVAMIRIGVVVSMAMALFLTSLYFTTLQHLGRVILFRTMAFAGVSML